MIPVIVESPFTGDRERNAEYLAACLLDCFNRGESPYASHAIGPLCLDDDVPEERELGIKAGFVWRQFATKTVVYTDLGMSTGMELGVQDANNLRTTRQWLRLTILGIPFPHQIEFRELGGKWNDI